MRIISLTRVATAWLQALGAMPDLVGVAPSCAPAGSKVPVLPGRLDGAVALPDLLVCQPDLVVTGPEGFPEVEAAGIPCFAFQAVTFKQALDQALGLARVIGRLPAAIQGLGAGEEALMALRRALDFGKRTAPERQPSVVCLASLAPLAAAGYWIPDVVERAGGVPRLCVKGGPDTALDPARLAAEDPDVLVVFPSSTARLPEELSVGWPGLRAVVTGRVWFLEEADFRMPGPGLYRATVRLARCLYPGRVPPDVDGNVFPET